MSDPSDIDPPAANWPRPFTDAFIESADRLRKAELGKLRKLEADGKIDSLRRVVGTVTRRHKAPEGECRYCDSERARNNSFHPPHDPSPYCESGKRSHCSCDTCF